MPLAFKKSATIFLLFYEKKINKILNLIEVSNFSNRPILIL